MVDSRTPDAVPTASSRNARTRPTVRSTVALVVMTSLALSGAAACGGDEPAEKSADKITFWTPHTAPYRMKAQKEIAAEFTEKTGIKVNVVGLAAADQNQTLVTGVASGKVPDVVLHTPDQTAAWNAQGLLDTETPQQIVDALGKDTFSESALRLVTVGGALGGVPSDGWGHLLYYRKDLIEDAGLQPPTSIDDVAKIATTLAKGKRSGIALGTKPGDPFTSESLEAMLLPNGCKVVDANKVTIESPQCVEGLANFQKLAAASGAGEFDVLSARAAYLDGNAAMVIFSSHLLDELAGLDPDNPVTCPECKKDPQFLVENTGFVAALTGPSNTTPAQYGSTLNLGIPRGAHTAEARKFIEFLLTDGYVDTLATATEGRIPLRQGTKDNPTEYVDAWGKLRFGADMKNEKSIADVYGQDVVDQLVQGANSFTRWGFGTDDAPLTGAVYSQHALAQNIAPLYKGEDPATVAKAMAEAVRGVQQDLD